jgi:hypothetical protein
MHGLTVHVTGANVGVTRSLNKLLVYTHVRQRLSCALKCCVGPAVLCYIVSCVAPAVGPPSSCC